MKKAQMPAAVMVTLIVILVISLLLFVFLNKAKGGMETSGIIEQCRSSMLNAQTIKQLTAGGKSSVIRPEFHCVAPHKHITDAEEEAIALQIRKELDNCWYKTLGNSNRLGYTDQWIWDSERIACLVCSTFELDHRLPKQKLWDALKEEIPAGDGGQTTEWYKKHLDMPKLMQEPPQFDWLYVDPSGYNQFAELKPMVPAPDLDLHGAAFSWYNLIPGVQAGRDLMSMTGQFYKYDFLRYFLPRNKYYIISINIGKEGYSFDKKPYKEGEYNHIAIVYDNDINDLRCSVFHYETE